AFASRRPCRHGPCEAVKLLLIHRLAPSILADNAACQASSLASGRLVPGGTDVDQAGRDGATLEIDDRPARLVAVDMTKDRAATGAIVVNRLAGEHDVDAGLEDAT